MYDELERAAGARPSTGLSLLGWLGVAVVFLGLVGTAGAFLAVRFVDRKIDETTAQFEAWMEAPATASATASATAEHALVARTVARTLGELDALPSVDESAVTESVRRALANVSEGRASDGPVEGTFRLTIGERTISADLHADDESGSLVVRDADGRTILDLSAHPEGGRLMIGAEGEVAHIEAGPGSVSAPRWLPSPADRGRDLERVVSGRAGSAAFGSVTWTSDADPARLVADYRAMLESEGWTIEAEHRLDDGGEESASVVAHLEDPKRAIVFAAGLDRGETRVVLGWGEGVGQSASSAEGP